MSSKPNRGSETMDDTYTEKSAYGKITISIGKVLNTLGVVALVAMLALTVGDVFMRFFFNKPIIGGTELIQGFMVCIVLGLGYSTSKGKSIKMDMIVQRLPDKAQQVIDSVTIILGLVIILFMTWGFVLEVPVVRDLKMRTAMLGVPEYLLFIVMAVGFGHLVLVMALLIAKNIAKVVSHGA